MRVALFGLSERISSPSDVCDAREDASTKRLLHAHTHTHRFFFQNLEKGGFEQETQYVNQYRCVRL